MNNQLFIKLFWFSALFFSNTILAFAEEKIVFFHSDIVVDKSGKMQVVETIRVRAEGYEIKRGIYRALPTVYKAKFGLDYKVKYKFNEVLRDGVADSWHTEKRNKEVQFYIGKEEYFLPNGFYTYTIKYTTENQIGFFDYFDELYWNVNGNYWNMQTDSVSAKITLPEQTEIISFGGYSGWYGENNQDFTINQINKHTVEFASNKVYNPNEGLTIVVGFPKGIVKEKSAIEKLFTDNLDLLIGVLGFLLALIYYLFSWNKVGIDPPKGIIVPLFEAPAGYSPAAVRFINNMGFDKKAFTATVINLAVKGYVKIEDQKGKNFSITKVNSDTTNLSESEANTFNAIFKSGLNILRFEQENHAHISSSINELKYKLQAEIGGNYFDTNSNYLWLGVIISLATIAAMVFINRTPEVLFFSVWIAIWSMGCLALLKQAISSIVQGNFWSSIGFTLFSLPFLGAWVLVVVIFGASFSLIMVVFLVAFLFLNVLFVHLIKAPTVMGRQVMDKIEGFKMYLKTAEQHRMELIKTTKENIELFEKYLPYAIALDCETEWTRKFNSTLQQAIKNGSYQPTWHTGTAMRNFNAAAFTSSISNSLHSAISTSSTAPSSSSRSGGGGFSGGGGGGGGGGGW